MKSPKMSANPSAEGTRIFTELRWVDWRPVTPNQLLFRHWNVVSRNSMAAHEAWKSSSPCVFTDGGLLTMITMSAHSNHFGMPLLSLSDLTMGTNPLLGNTPRFPHEASKASK